MKSMDPNLYYGGIPPKSLFERLGGYFIEFFETLVVFAAVFAILYLFIAQFHKVSGSSMFPTLRNGDFLITEKVNYRFGNPKRGDIIVLKNPRDNSQDFIKRIIALPNDSVKLEKNSLFINGVPFKEPYLSVNIPTNPGAFLIEGVEVKVGPNQYFVFGDNRTHSSDSREWGGVTKEEIVGRAFFRYWPPESVGLLTKK